MSTYRRSVIAGLLCVAAAIFAAVPASAQTNTYNAAETPPPAISTSGPVGEVLSTTGQRVVTPLPAVTGQVLSLQVTQPAPVITGGQASVSGLAFTGADIITLLLLALPLIAVGLVLTRQGRPRQASQG